MAVRWFKKLATRVMKPTCGDCGADIAAEDVNLRRGVMLCRECGALTHIGSRGEDDPVDEAMAEWSATSPPVPKPHRTSVRLVDEGQRLTLSRRTGNLATGGFLLLWLTGWTAGCVFLVAHVIAEPSLFLVLFATPFVVAWFGVAAILVWKLFGCETLTIDGNGLTLTRRALFFGYTRSVVVDEQMRIASCLERAGGEDGRSREGIEIQTGDKPLQFGYGLRDDERVWVADLIRRRLGFTMPPRAAARTPASGTRDESVARAHGNEQWRRSQPQPTGCTVKLHDEPDGVIFTRAQRHDFTLVGCLGAIFTCLFWNGIVSVFVYALISGKAKGDMGTGGAWFMAVFLIPFVVIGFMIFLAALSSVATLVATREWRIGQELVQKYRVLGVGPTRRRQWQNVKQVLLQAASGEEKQLRFRRRVADEEGFELVLVADGGEELLRFRGLTENEARWILGEIHARHAHWLRNATFRSA